jgi:hypothetical protein
MRFARSLLLATCIAGASTAFGAIAGSSGCGTDAVGVDACVIIENKRCELVGSTGCDAEFDVDFCKDYYRDQCLHGIENADHNPSEAEIDACVAALDQAASCQAAGILTMGECADGALLMPGVDPDLAPCTILRASPQNLIACSFVANPVDAGIPVGTGGAGGSGGAGGAGGGVAGSGGSGGATVSSSSSSSSATTGGAGGTGTAGGGGTGG